MTREKYLPYGHQKIDEDDIRSVSDALLGEFLTTGPLVKIFEEKLQKITNSNYSVACSSGTSALHLACKAIGLKEGDWVIVPTITFLATANAVRYCGANVLFCDVDPETGLITNESVKEAIQRAKENNLSLKAIIIVHLAGRFVDLKKIKELAVNEKLKIIADSCHALGGVYEDRPIGQCYYEDLNTFSFHPVKTITTGEGGAVTTKSEELSSIMATMRHHNMVKTDKKNNPWKYEMKMLGYNYRISDIQCALGISQIKKLKSFVEKRSMIVSTYNKHIIKLFPIISRPCLSIDQNRTQHSWHLYTVLLNLGNCKLDRGTLMKKLSLKGIGTQVHYIPVHTQPYYENLYGPLNLPGANRYFENTLSLPLFPKMKAKDVEYVVKEIGSLLL
tara:strand:+ start:329 stop:1498 length:1170 start_codon:yes stop_codon:yes gene_type:complete